MDTPTRYVPALPGQEAVIFAFWEETTDDRARPTEAYVRARYPIVAWQIKEVCGVVYGYPVLPGDFVDEASERLLVVLPDGRLRCIDEDASGGEYANIEEATASLLKETQTHWDIRNNARKASVMVKRLSGAA